MIIYTKSGHEIRTGDIATKQTKTVGGDFVGLTWISTTVVRLVHINIDDISAVVNDIPLPQGWEDK